MTDKTEEVIEASMVSVIDGHLGALLSMEQQLRTVTDASEDLQWAIAKLVATMKYLEKVKNRYS